MEDPSVLILFDIDSTLLQIERGLSMRNFRRSFGQAHRLERVRVDEGYRFHGRTDRSIYRDVCVQNSIDEDQAKDREVEFVDLLVGG